MTPHPKTPARRALWAGTAILALTTIMTPLWAVAEAAPQITPIGVSYADIVAQDKPAVVTITTTMAAQSQAPSGLMPMPGGGGTPYDQFFQQFFGPNGPYGQGGPGQQQQRPDRPAMALGSGFIIDASGVIVTNNHVIDGAEKITVTLEDGQEYPATLVGADSRTDIAVLRIDAGSDLPTVSWGDSDLLRVGDPIIAIGNPFGVGTTVTSGIVSARGRDLHNGPYDDFIQVDAAINHGNSGGALIDSSGSVVGITAAIYSPNDGNVGLGFAIPSDQAKIIVADLMDGGSVERGYLGVQIQPVTKDIADALGLAEASGALVGDVTEGSPAGLAGIKSGDVVLAVAGTPVKDARDLSRIIAGDAPGTQVAVNLWRDGAKQDVTVTLAALPTEEQLASADPVAPAQATETALGLTLVPIPSDARAQLGLSQTDPGLMISAVDPSSAAANEGIQQGDVVIAVNGAEIGKPGQIEKILKVAAETGHDKALLLIDRQGQRLFVALPTV